MTTWLIDKSAFARLATSPDAAEWATRIDRRLVRITTVTRLEVGYSARSGSDLRTGFAQPPLSSMPVEYMTPAIEDRAVEALSGGAIVERTEQPGGTRRMMICPAERNRPTGRMCWRSRPKRTGGGPV